MKTRALALGVPVRQHRSLKAPEIQREVSALDADLGVMAYVTQIVPLGVIDTPRHGSICFHPSLLPQHRGGSAIPWQIILGKTRTGVTVFWADAGIDTGPILLQKEAAIDPSDTAATLYFEKLFPLGVDAVLESVDLVSAGSAPRVPQDESRATYEPLCRDEYAAIDWQRPAAELYNLIRGCDPQPGAYVLIGGDKVRLYDARLERTTDTPLGVIGALDDAGILIGAVGGAIRLGRMRVGSKKVAAREAAEMLGVGVGDRLSD